MVKLRQNTAIVSGNFDLGLILGSEVNLHGLLLVGSFLRFGRGLPTKSKQRHLFLGLNIYLLGDISSYLIYSVMPLSFEHLERWWSPRPLFFPLVVGAPFALLLFSDARTLVALGGLLFAVLLHHMLGCRVVDTDLLRGSLDGVPLLVHKPD